MVEKSFASIDYIVKSLKAGAVAVLPSENVYGLAGNGLMENVVERIYRLKKRERQKPLVFFTSKEKAENYGQLDERAKKIIRLWPNGVGIIVPKKTCVPSFVTAGKRSIMLVCVDEFLEAVANKADFPIVGTSANISGAASIVDFETAFTIFNDKVEIIVKGRPSKRGMSGTILNLTVDPPRIERKGPVTVEEIQDILACKVTVSSTNRYIK